MHIRDKELKDLEKARIQARYTTMPVDARYRFRAGLMHVLRLVTVGVMHVVPNLKFHDRASFSICIQAQYRALDTAQQNAYHSLAKEKPPGIEKANVRYEGAARMMDCTLDQMQRAKDYFSQPMVWYEYVYKACFTFIRLVDPVYVATPSLISLSSACQHFAMCPYLQSTVRFHCRLGN